MEIFLSLLIKIIPLYIIILCGFLAAKYYNVQKDSIAKIAIFFLSPAIVFVGVKSADLSTNIIILPLIFFVICALICFLSFYFGKFLFKDSTRNIFALMSSNANIGYFGVPVCLALLGESALSIAVITIFGFTIFENTIGYYILARSNYSIKESIYKIFKLPAVYAFIFGLIINKLDLTLPNAIIQTTEILKGAYSPLGMMIIGLSLASVKLHHVDLKFISFSLINKFLLWLLVSVLIVFLDQNYFHLFNDMIHKVFIIQSITPIAANTVAFASLTNVHPEKAAIGVFISTVLALIFIPFTLSILPLFQ